MVNKVNTDSEIVEVVNFKPTPAMIQAKLTLHKEWKIKFPKKDIKECSMKDAIYICGTSTVRNWWKKEGFLNWLLDIFYYNFKLESIRHSALDRLETMLASGQLNPMEELKAIQLAMELHKKYNEPNTDERYKELLRKNKDLANLPVDKLEARVLEAEDKARVLDGYISEKGKD